MIHFTSLKRKLIFTIFCLLEIEGGSLSLESRKYLLSIL